MKLRNNKEIDMVLDKMIRCIEDCGCHRENCERFFRDVGLDSCAPIEDSIEIEAEIKREELFNTTAFICGWLSDCEVKKSRILKKERQCECGCFERVLD